MNQSEQWLLARCRILQLASSCCLSEAVSDKTFNGRSDRSLCAGADTTVITSVTDSIGIAAAMQPPLNTGGQPALSSCGSTCRGCPLFCAVSTYIYIYIYISSSTVLYVHYFHFTFFYVLLALHFSDYIFWQLV